MKIHLAWGIMAMGKNSKSTSGKLPVAKPLSDMSCSPVSSKPNKEQIERERRWKAEEATRTLQRAKEITADKSLMKDVKMYANEQIKKLKSI